MFTRASSLVLPQVLWVLYARGEILFHYVLTPYYFGCITLIGVALFYLIPVACISSSPPGRVRTKGGAALRAGYVLQEEQPSGQGTYCRKSSPPGRVRTKGGACTGISVPGPVRLRRFVLHCVCAVE